MPRPVMHFATYINFQGSFYAMICCLTEWWMTGNFNIPWWL